MFKIVIGVSALAFIAGSAMAEPLTLTDDQMDQITASGLGLPSGDEVFVDFDNPAPGPEHPNFDRSATAIANTANMGPVNGDLGNEGPWSAHFASPVIDCIGCGP